MGVLLNEDLPESKPRHKGLSHCCCGCSLQTGCVIIGSLGVINGISTLYVALYALCHSGSGMGGIEEGHIISNIIMLLYGLVHLTTGLSLIYGADKRRPALLNFWLYTRYVEFMIIVLAALYFLTVMLTSGAPSFHILASALASLTFGISVLVYCIAVVQSFRREITEFDNILPLKEDI